MDMDVDMVGMYIVDVELGAPKLEQEQKLVFDGPPKKVPKFVRHWQRENSGRRTGTESQVQRAKDMAKTKCKAAAKTKGSPNKNGAGVGVHVLMSGV